MSAPLRGLPGASQQPGTPSVEGGRPLGAADRSATAGSILAVQEEDGRIPRAAGQLADPWNHLEAAMALACSGELAAASAALDWLAGTQRPDGAWHAAYGPGGEVAEARLDTSGTAYLAVGLLACAEAGGGAALLVAHEPMLRRALAFVLAHQRPGGEIGWSELPAGERGGFALLAGCCSMHASLLAGTACARLLGRSWPELEAAADRLRGAICWRRSAFLAKDEYAMDWYYPVLGGALDLDEARARLAQAWERFVQPGRGVLCRSDRRWVTTAETAECALACLRCGLRAEARLLLEWTAPQRSPDGAYLTGLVYPEGSQFPAGERTTYSAAAVLLAEDALAGGAAARVLAPALADPGGREEEVGGAAG